MISLGLRKHAFRCNHELSEYGRNEGKKILVPLLHTSGLRMLQLAKPRFRAE
jgi:hypothetical protein